MEHRHLLPDEIDQLVDGEAGFGVAPLVAHVEQCADCRAEVEEARLLVATLERLPHFTPSPLFSERVMTQVQVLEPWHVAAANNARRFVPRSLPARILAAGSLGGMGLVLSATLVWLLVRLDAAMFFFKVAADRTRDGLVNMLGGAVATALGEPALDALRTSGPGAMAGILTGLLLTVLAATLGLRALAVASRRRRG